MKELGRRQRGERALLAALKSELADLEHLLESVSTEWGYEDSVYRFYHQSFKVYRVQQSTLQIVEALRALAPDQALNAWFMTIVEEGTGKTFEDEHNARWLQVTRPVIEAFLHARFFLEMACKYARELDEPPEVMPSGWAALLYLYNLR